MIVMNTLKAYLGAGCFSTRYFPIFTCIFLLFAQSTYAQNRYSMVRIPTNEVKHMQDLFDLGVDDDQSGAGITAKNKYLKYKKKYLLLKEKVDALKKK